MVIKFEKDVLRKAKAHFNMYGTKSRCAAIKSINRATISTAVKNGQAEERVVNAITEYIKEVA